ncbi:MAG: hypothetical protein SH817_16580 [Leptospira sp.]|nr:hypothetical protein [Leptospira sp.]
MEKLQKNLGNFYALAFSLLMFTLCATLLDENGKFSPFGGEVTNANVSLDIPAGAVSENTNFSVSLQYFSESDVPGITQVASKVVLKPEGLTFAKPETLTIKYDSKLVNSQLQYELNQIYFHKPASNEWEQQITTVDNVLGKLITELSHFSTYCALHVIIEKIVSRILTDSPLGDPLLSTFSTDDFDQDGARNSSDTKLSRQTAIQSRTQMNLL